MSSNNINMHDRTCCLKFYLQSLLKQSRIMEHMFLVQNPNSQSIKDISHSKKKSRRVILNIGGRSNKVIIYEMHLTFPIF